MAKMRQFVGPRGDSKWLPEDTHPWPVYRLQCDSNREMYDYHLIETEIENKAKNPNAS